MSTDSREIDKLLTAALGLTIDHRDAIAAAQLLHNAATDPLAATIDILGAEARAVAGDNLDACLAYAMGVCFGFGWAAHTAYVREGGL